MSSKAKAPKKEAMEAPMSPSKSKSKKAKSPNKGPKSPAKVKSVKKAAETPVKTLSKKKAAETPQTKPKEKRSGPYEARWKKAMYVLLHLFSVTLYTQEHLPEVPARVRT